ncbi:MAG: RNA polymerase sigma factor [Phycisphaerae bacterium]
MSADEHRLLYEKLVHAHWRELYAYAYRLLFSRVEAEDAVQQTFLQAWISIRQLQDISSARAWLYTILRRTCWRMIDRPDEARTSLPTDLADHNDHHRQIDEQDSVSIALSQLERKFRDPFLMVAMEGLTCREAARELGIPLGTVLSRIARARERLECLLAQPHDATETRTSKQKPASDQAGSGGDR